MKKFKGTNKCLDSNCSNSFALYYGQWLICSQFPTAGKCGALLIQCTVGFHLTSPNFKSKKLLLLPSFYFCEP